MTWDWGRYDWGLLLGGGFELIDFFATGLRAAPQYGFGLRRRNNELNELTNCRAARGRRIAPEGGAYSRIGACPYLPPQLINSRCCPCKGRISWAGLAPQYLSRYEPLTGARFINRPQEVGASPYPKYEPPSGALAPQVRDIRAALRGLKAQQVRSPGQRPGLTYVPHLRPVRAKVKANRSPILLPLQGVGLYTLIPRALPWAENWLPFQGARGAIRHYSPHPSSPKFVNSCNSLLRRLRPKYISL